MRGQGEDAADVVALANEIISTSIGANVTCLMYPDGAIIAEHRTYVDRLMRRITC